MIGEKEPVNYERRMNDTKFAKLKETVKQYAADTKVAHSAISFVNLEDFSRYRIFSEHWPRVTLIKWTETEIRAGTRGTSLKLDIQNTADAEHLEAILTSSVSYRQFQAFERCFQKLRKVSSLESVPPAEELDELTKICQKLKVFLSETESICQTLRDSTPKTRRPRV